MKTEKIQKILRRRFNALDEWDFTENTTLADIKGKDEAEALGRYWELLELAREFGVEIDYYGERK